MHKFHNLTQQNIIKRAGLVVLLLGLFLLLMTNSTAKGQAGMAELHRP